MDITPTPVSSELYDPHLTPHIPPATDVMDGWIGVDRLGRVADVAARDPAALTDDELRSVAAYEPVTAQRYWHLRTQALLTLLTPRRAPVSPAPARPISRSEEHTSELQSP